MTEPSEIDLLKQENSELRQQIINLTTKISDLNGTIEGLSKQLQVLLNGGQIDGNTSINGSICSNNNMEIQSAGGNTSKAAKRPSENSFEPNIKRTKNASKSDGKLQSPAINDNSNEDDVSIKSFNDDDDENATFLHKQNEIIGNNWTFVGNKKKANSNQNSKNGSKVNSSSPITSQTTNSSNNVIQLTPIQLKKMSPQAGATLINHLYREFGGNGYVWQQIKNGGAPRISTEDENTKNRIIKFLSDHGYEFNTYNSKNQKKKAFIVRGFCYGLDNDNTVGITEALKSVGITEEFVVTRFQTGYQKNHSDVNQNLLYKIVIDGSFDDNILKNIRNIGHFLVKFERMKSSKVIQCKRCQRFSHTASQCFFNYRCVQCVNLHDPGCCPRGNNKKLALGCINCQENGFNHNGHTANDFKNCKFFNEKIQPHIKHLNRNDNSTKNQQSININGNNIFSSASNVNVSKSHSLKKSYANAVKSGYGQGKSNFTTTNNNSVDDFTHQVSSIVSTVIQQLISNGLILKNK